MSYVSLSRQALQFVRHDLQFSLLSEARFQRGAEGVKGETALGLQNLVGQFLLLLLEVGGIGSCFSATR